jgi:hypothetical protein
VRDYQTDYCIKKKSAPYKEGNGMQRPSFSIRQRSAMVFLPAPFTGSSRPPGRPLSN